MFLFLTAYKFSSCNGENVRRIQSVKHQNDDMVETDTGSQSSTMEDEIISLQDNITGKTSSSRRKLRTPKKNSPSINKISSQSRKSRRSQGVGQNKSPKELKHNAFESVDKENEASCLVTNSATKNNQMVATKVLPCMMKQNSERKSGRRSSSTASHSPIVSAPPGCKRKFDEGYGQMIKHSSTESELEVHSSSQRKDSVLKEIGKKLERQIKSPVHSSKTNKISQKPFEKLHDIFNEKYVEKGKGSKVYIERLSPENEEISYMSPVKIVNESPLKIVPVDNSVQPSPVARKINFDDVNNKKTDLLRNFDADSDIVNGSQEEGQELISLKKGEGII